MESTSEESVHRFHFLLILLQSLWTYNVFINMILIIFTLETVLAHANFGFCATYYVFRLAFKI